MPYKDLDERKRKHAAYSANHYEKNKEEVKQKNRLRRKTLRAKWVAYKSGFVCTKCGEDHPATFDFHHIVRSDYSSINKLIADGRFTKAMEEVKKCICLCANCHRKLHYEEREAKRIKT